MRTTNLFIVTDLCIINGKVGELCLLMKGHGPLQPFGSSILVSNVPGPLRPILQVCSIQPDWDMMVSHARYDLGDKAGQLIMKSKADSFQLNGADNSTGDLQTCRYAVFVHGILHTIRHSPLFGVITVLTRNMIDDLKKRKPRKGIFHKKINGLNECPNMMPEDLSFADQALAHFQLLSDVEASKRSKLVMKELYSK